MLTGDHIAKMLRAAGASTTGKVAPLDVIADLFNDAMIKHGDGQFTTTERVAALVSECMMESAWFGAVEEFRKDGRYAPYIGRGFIQLTWKANYAAFGKWCKSLGLVDDADYFVKNPTRLADLKWAALTGTFYFTQVTFDGKPLTAYANNIDQVGKAVNRGNPYHPLLPSGYKPRRAAYKAVLALGPTIIPTSSEETSVPISVPFNSWLSHVRDAVQDTVQQFPTVSAGTYNGHHPTKNRAVDYMIPSYKTAAGKALGWKLARWTWDNRKRLNVWYVIFDGKIISETRPAAGWADYKPTAQAIRNSRDSAYHYNHVHVSHNAKASTPPKTVTLYAGTNGVQGYKIKDGVGVKSDRYLRKPGHKLTGTIQSRSDGKYLVTPFQTWYPLDDLSDTDPTKKGTTTT